MLEGGVPYLETWRRRWDSNPRIEVLQTPALDRLATSPSRTHVPFDQTRPRKRCYQWTRIAQTTSPPRSANSIYQTVQSHASKGYGRGPSAIYVSSIIAFAARYRTRPRSPDD